MKICIISLAIVLSVMYISNQLASGFLHGFRMNTSQRARAATTNFYQFTSGNIVGGSGIRRNKYDDTFHVYTHSNIGTKVIGGGSKGFKYSLIKNKVLVDYQLSIIAVDPEIETSDGIKKMLDPKIAEKILDKNGDDTVSLVDLSLTDFISYEETIEYLEKYDMKIMWMSIDSGMEEKKISGMKNGMNQHFQFGIPGKIFNTNNFDTKELNKDNGEDYKEFALNRMKMLKENLEMLEPDNMRKRGGYETTVLDGEIDYIIENGIKVYGLRITGPSNELSRFLKDINPRFAEVKDIDFWYWDK